MADGIVYALTEATTFSEPGYVWIYVDNNGIDRKVALTSIVPVARTTITNANLDGSYTYTYTHNLDTAYPIVHVMDGSGNIIGLHEVQVQKTSVNAVKFYFNAPITGTYYLTVFKIWV
jgi:hypothetical protein